MEQAHKVARYMSFLGWCQLEVSVIVKWASCGHKPHVGGEKFQVSDNELASQR